MEQMQSDTPQQTTPERRQRRKKATLPIPRFLSNIGQDVRWYYDVRLWSPLILLLLILAILPGRKQPAQQTPEHTDLIQQEETQPTVEATEPEPLLPEAVALARLADSVGYGRSDNVKTIIMWVAINRSEDKANGYGLSLEEEIARANQWQDYDAYIAYSDETYAIAVNVLETQANGGLRPLREDMLWFVLNDNGSITVRDQFTAKANEKWYERTIF